MISRLIEAKPDELRVYIEEAAGISKYRERRRETEHRIRHTRENLDRLNDIREELDRQLNHLQRQARAAERYQVLRQEERQTRAELLALNWRDLKAEIEQREEKVREHENRLEEGMAELRKTEADIERLRDELGTANETFNQLKSDYYQVGGDISQLEQKIQHTKERMASLEADLEETRESIRAGDVLARLGGDEFAVLLEGLSGALEAEMVARSILEVVAEPFQVDGREVKVTTSIGISVYPNDNNDTATLLKNADIAMYQAKEKGRNNFKFFTERMHDELVAYHELERDIREAISTESFRLVFQPKVNLVTRKLQGLEALLRWVHQHRGNVPPLEFIPVAEQSGHIVPLGHWVFNEVCRTINRWKAKGLPVVPVAINVSARQFQQPDFYRRVTDTLSRHAVDPTLIEIELTEGLLMEDTASVQRSLQQLKDIGVRISIDDFGTGHSCLNYLRRFPIDVLKIDKSFVHDVDHTEDSAIIIDAIISLARSLQLDTVAEGVETREQLNFLVDRGCQVAQGFLFGQPMQAREVLPFLEDLIEDDPGFVTARLHAADIA